jgi:hypothetical protein
MTEKKGTPKEKIIAKFNKYTYILWEKLFSNIFASSK